MDSLKAIKFCRSSAAYALGVVLWLGVLIGRAAEVPAQLASTTSSFSGNRYLFVIETSRSMQRRAPGVLEAVQGLLNSGMKNQLRPGDSLGVWTYNDHLYTGQLPLEHWKPENGPGVAVHLIEFLQSLNYEKKASFDKVFPELERVARESESITIILLSSGEERIKGTPFDDALNSSYKQWLGESAKAKGPFVTVLRAKAGKFTDWIVTPPNWPPELPSAPTDSQPDNRLASLDSHTVPKAPASAALDSTLHLASPKLLSSSSNSSNVASARPPTTNAPAISQPKPVETKTVEQPTAVASTTPPLIVAPKVTSSAANAPPKPLATEQSAPPAPKENAAPAPTKTPIPPKETAVASVAKSPPAQVSSAPAAQSKTSQADPPVTPAAAPKSNAASPVVNTQPKPADPVVPLSSPQKNPAPVSEPIPAPAPVVAAPSKPVLAAHAPVLLAAAAPTVQPIANAPEAPRVAPADPPQPTPAVVRASRPIASEPAPSSLAPQQSEPVPHASFAATFRENGVWWVLLLGAGVTALFCFRMWIGTFIRRRPPVAGINPEVEEAPAAEAPVEEDPKGLTAAEQLK